MSTSDSLSRVSADCKRAIVDDGTMMSRAYLET